MNCTKCSQPITLADKVESINGHLVHVDCKRPQVLTPEERTLVFVYCAGHVVARCPACDISYRYTELAGDMVGGNRANMCPRCRRGLTEAIRAHILRCPMLPNEVQLRARAVREAAQRLVKEGQELRDNADVLIREAEAALFESRKALHAAMSKRSLN